MALSDKHILEKIKSGDVVILPFKSENLSSSSYDVTLGEFYYKCSIPSEEDVIYLNENGFSEKKILYNPYSEKDVHKVWKLNRAIRWGEIKSGEVINGENISDEDLVILIGPGDSLLCHTNEFIGGKNEVTTMMKSRSSFGRNFLESCSCAGWGDVGYINRWTMEVRNNSKHYTIPLIVGRRVAQIVFLPTGKTMKQYHQSGKYQTEENLEDLEKNWRPEFMLPKMYLDREIFIK